MPLDITDDIRTGSAYITLGDPDIWEFDHTQIIKTHDGNSVILDIDEMGYCTGIEILYQGTD